MLRLRKQMGVGWFKTRPPVPSDVCSKTTTWTALLLLDDEMRPVPGRINDITKFGRIMNEMITNKMCSSGNLEYNRLAWIMLTLLTFLVCARDDADANERFVTLQRQLRV